MNIKFYVFTWYGIYQECFGCTFEYAKKYAKKHGYKFYKKED